MYWGGFLRSDYNSMIFFNKCSQMLQFSHLFFYCNMHKYFFVDYLQKKKGKSSTSSLFQDSSPEFLFLIRESALSIDFGDFPIFSAIC